MARANLMLEGGAEVQDIRSTLASEIPIPPTQIDLHEPSAIAFHENLIPTDADEEANLSKVRDTMRVVMHTLTVVGGAIMPDACPAGPIGTIPVGGVVAAKNAIHPGMHSADICCSLMMTDLGDADPAVVMEAAAKVTHFGPGGRAQGQRFTVSLDLLDAFRANPFLSNAKTIRAAQEQMGTQGGAGRNWSRTEHMRRLGAKTADEALAEETAGLDVRFHSGKVDASELPSSYKPAAAVAAQIESFDLAEFVDWIDPDGCIMAGNMPRFIRRPKGRR